MVSPDRWNTLVGQESGDVNRFNAAVHNLGGPTPTVTETPIVLRDDKGQFGNASLFKVTAADGQSHLVDAQGATYSDVDDYMQNNQLDDSWTMIRPAQPGAPAGTPQQLVSGPAHNTTFMQRATKIGDQLAAPAIIAGGALVVGASALTEVGTVGLGTPVAAPAAMLGGGMIATGVAWTAAHSGSDLIDRYQHGRDLSWTDPQARADYLGLAGATGGGVGIAAKSLGATTAAALGDRVAIGAGANQVLDQGVALHNNWQNLTPAERAQHTAELATGIGTMTVPLANRAMPEGGIRPPGAGPRPDGANAPTSAGQAKLEGRSTPAGVGEPRQANGPLAAQPQRVPATGAVSAAGDVPRGIRADSSASHTPAQQQSLPEALRDNPDYAYSEESGENGTVRRLSPLDTATTHYSGSRPPTRVPDAADPSAVDLSPRQHADGPSAFSPEVLGQYRSDSRIPTSELTADAAQSVFDIRSSDPIQPGVPVAKIMTKQGVDALVNKTSPFPLNRIAGSFARQSDVAHLRTFQEMRDGLGLDDSQTVAAMKAEADKAKAEGAEPPTWDGRWNPIPPGATKAYQLRWITSRDIAGESKIPFGGPKNEDLSHIQPILRATPPYDKLPMATGYRPFTGTGSTSGGYPEWVTNGTDVGDLAGIWEMDESTGEWKPYAKYDPQTMEWNLVTK